MTYFDWDETKDRSNQGKHGLSFKQASQVFTDPLCLVTFDRVVHGEDRWHAVGLTAGMLLLLVVHTVHEEDETDEIIRIISARRATPKERVIYEAEYGSLHA